jgi:hypothetical protein
VTRRLLLALLLLWPVQAWADFCTAVGYLKTTTGTSNVVVDFAQTPDCTPKVVIFFGNGRTETTNTLNTSDAEQGMAIGATVGTDNATADTSGDDGDEGYICNSMTDAAATETGGTIINTKGAFCETDAARNELGYFTLVSFDTDGFTVNPTNAFPTDQTVGYLALGGSDITNVDVEWWDELGTTGNQSRADAGFQPTCMLVFGSEADSPAEAGDTEINATMSIGAADGTRQGWSGVASDNGVTTIEQWRAGNTSRMRGNWDANPTSTVIDEFSYVSFDTNGFTINWNASAGSTGTQQMYVAIKGIQCYVGDITTATGTGDLTAETVGFEPKAGLIWSHGAAATATATSVDNYMLTVGAFTSTSNRIAFGVESDSDPDPTQVSSAIRFDAVYVNQTTDAVAGLMDISAISSTGFTPAMDDGDPAAAHVNYIVFGAAPAAATRRVMVVD